MSSSLLSRATTQRGAAQIHPLLEDAAEAASPPAVGVNPAVGSRFAHVVEAALSDAERAKQAASERARRLALEAEQEAMQRCEVRRPIPSPQAQQREVRGSQLTQGPRLKHVLDAGAPLEGAAVGARFVEAVEAASQAELAKRSAEEAARRMALFVEAVRNRVCEVHL